MIPERKNQPRIPSTVRTPAPSGLLLDDHPLGPARANYFFLFVPEKRIGNRLSVIVVAAVIIIINEDDSASGDLVVNIGDDVRESIKIDERKTDLADIHTVQYVRSVSLDKLNKGKTVEMLCNCLVVQVRDIILTLEPIDRYDLLVDT